MMASGSSYERRLLSKTSRKEPLARSLTRTSTRTLKTRSISALGASDNEEAQMSSSEEARLRMLETVDGRAEVGELNNASEAI